MRLLLAALLLLGVIAKGQGTAFSPRDSSRVSNPFSPYERRETPKVLRSEGFDIAKVGLPGRVETTPLFKRIWEDFRTSHRLTEDGSFELGSGFPESADNQAFFLHYLANNVLTVSIQVNEICPRCKDKGYKSGLVRSNREGGMDEVGEVECDLCEGRGGAKGLVEYRVTYSSTLPAMPVTPAQAKFRTNLDLAEKGDPRAQLEVGEALWKGKGTEINRETALRWFGKAAFGGNQPAARRMIEIYSGKSTQDFTDTGFAAALHLLWLPRTGIDWSLTAHPQPRQGEVEARILLNQIRKMISDDPKVDFPLAGEVRRKLRTQGREWQIQASSGNDKAAHFFGACQLMAIGIDRDTRGAVEWLEKSALKGHAGSIHLLGCLYEDGLVYDKNLTAAYVMYTLATKATDSEYGSAGYAGKIRERIVAVEANKLLTEIEAFAKAGKLTTEHLAKVTKLPPGIPEPVIIAQKPDTGNRPPSRTTGERTSFGSGIVITKEGHIATNQHVIEGGKEIWIVRYVDGNLVDRKRAHIVTMDSTVDLAILLCPEWKPIEGVLQDPPPMAMSSDLRLGDSVFVLGFPLPHVTSSNVKYTKGDISDLAGLHNDKSNIQHTAPIQPGNSGGPMCLMDGRVAGIVVSSLGAGFALRTSGSLPQGVNFSVKIDNLKVLADSVAIRLPSGQPTSGNPVEHVKAYTVQIQVEK